ncbi:hypothetical protein KAFR_0B00100 [Kazachstania africana CBS 2517]|uniref:Zn(2)-C6 fungal-type domain-containing protein n=1 Tax=Kazachstania africana (strain ATCC 22294 / BCRC 22015 / CBS 2517 / CECT 1963 / NBRC 1671 / NRRL Y-8276) TaxID=1071382 RepID=H2APK8_KAZAF|nr:hypothetical protein KAFR_0B00100 [Kazachstania africana CBS 2517]CCF56308.1 hypothetical protein KAFR_0B00100 [Kazachstania africana CBS 2517]
MKSCVFCRKRKLKCDKTKPVCGQCTKRKLPKCVYVESYNFDLREDDLFSGLPNLKLLERIQELESLFRTVCHSSPTMEDSDIISAKHDVSNYLIINSDDKRMIRYGLTSYMNGIQGPDDYFVREFRGIWESVIKVYEDIERTANDAKHFVDFIPLAVSESVLNSLCSSLPNYNDMKTGIKDFFNNPLHEMTSFLDEEKIFEEFDKYFLYGATNSTNATQLTLYQILVPENNNIFKIAIILQVYCFARPKMVPSMIASFLEMVSNSNGSFGVEKAQFLLLRYFYKSFYEKRNFWDNSDDILYTVSTLINCCTTIGLYDVDKWYFGMQASVGDINCLKHPFYWALLVDVTTSIHYGKPLCISSTYLHLGRVFDQNVNIDATDKKNERRSRILKLFLRLSVNYIDQLSNMRLIYLNELINEYLRFVEEHFLPLKFYTNLEYALVVDKYDVFFLSHVLGILTSLYHLKIKYLTGTSISTINEFLKTSLISISLCTATIIAPCNAPLALRSSRDEDLQTLYLNHSLYLVSPLTLRTIHQAYDVALLLITTVQGTQFNESAERLSFFENLTSDKGEAFSSLFVTRTFESILNKLMEPESQDSSKTLRQSQYLISILLFAATWKATFTRMAKAASVARQRIQDEKMGLETFSFKDLVFSIYNENFKLSREAEFRTIIKEVID